MDEFEILEIEQESAADLTETETSVQISSAETVPDYTMQLEGIAVLLAIIVCVLFFCRR